MRIEIDFDFITRREFLDSEMQVRFIIDSLIKEFGNGKIDDLRIHLVREVDSDDIGGTD
jgi:hypothetical protein